MKKRKWILYPYSTFHARMIGGFVHLCFINNPTDNKPQLIIVNLAEGLITALPFFIGTSYNPFVNPKTINFKVYNIRQLRRCAF